MFNWMLGFFKSIKSYCLVCQDVTACKDMGTANIMTTRGERTTRRLRCKTCGSKNSRFIPTTA